MATAKRTWILALNRRVEKLGRSRQSHKLEIAGSNPASATNHTAR